MLELVDKLELLVGPVVLVGVLVVGLVDRSVEIGDVVGLLAELEGVLVIEVADC